MIETYFFYFGLFVFGTVFGSFLNLVADRVVSGEPILFGRSKCDFCRKKLKVLNLVPIFSFIFQKGKSICCKEKLSWSYPISEFLTGAAFLFAGHYVNISKGLTLSKFFVFLYVLTVLCFYIVLLMTDAKYRLLPDKVVYVAIAVTAVFIVLMTFVDLKAYHDALLQGVLGKYLIQAGFWKNHLFVVFKNVLVLFVSVIFISLFFLSLILITRGRGMGGGDVKLGFLIGLFNGFPANVLAVFIGFLLGSLYSMFLIAMNKKGMKDTIAFGPFLIVGSVIAFIWGDSLINWYLGLV